MLGHAVQAFSKLLRPAHVGPMNPSFPITIDAAHAQLAATSPRPLDRPLVVLGGFLDLGVGPRAFARPIAPVIGADVPWLTFAHCVSFDQCRRRVVAAVDRLFGSADDPAQTIEIDVVGQSMGGLLALLAAQDDGTRRLNVRRLFTISSPLCGARLARLLPFDVAPLHRDMRPASACVAQLGAAERSCEVVSYVRLGDATVGPEHAALPGGELWWLDNPRPERPHVGALTDWRIVLDVARRVRGEPPIATHPPTPLP